MVNYTTTALLLSLLMHFPARAESARTFAISNTDSRVTFTISKWMVFKEEGRFRSVRGSVSFSPERISESSIHVVVDARSLDTGNTTRDEVVRSDDFLHVERFPEITFRSSRVAQGPGNTLEVTGDLTIRGVTRRITVPVEFLGRADVSELGEILAFETGFLVDRTEFGVLGSRWSGGKAILGHDVSVRLTVGAVRRHSRD